MHFPARANPVRAVATLAVLLVLSFSMPAAANHAASHRINNPTAPAAGARLEALSGAVEALTLVDRVHDTSRSYFTLRLADGSLVGLRDIGREIPAAGDAVVVTGRRTEGVFFVESLAADRAAVFQPRAASAVPGATIEGTLEFLHADDFEHGRCELRVTVVDADGRHTNVRLPVYPDELERGMRVRVAGRLSADRADLEPATIEILAPSPAADLAPVSGTSRVLMILIKYSDTATEPYTQANAQNVMFDAANSVANYYRETSYTTHQLAGVVTPWLTARFATPATCDYSSVASEAMYLANQAGYTTSQYQKFVYLFPTLPGCGWAGLGGGSQAWINQSLGLLVVGHELGHTFGLGHASSVDCGSLTIGGACTKSEYGDPAEIMGNQRATHFNAPHKEDLAYLPAGTVKTHTGGSANYVIEPLETAGRSTYAVKVFSSAKRTYWIEYRQPVGTFDAALGTGITGGAYIHLDWNNEYGCDTCVIDMTPATTSFTDAALPVGSQFVDAETGTTITAVSANASALSVSVATPARPTFADVPGTHWAYGEIEAIAWNGVTRGCMTNPLQFCPTGLVSRAEMAVFLERMKRGTNFAFTATGTTFSDVSSTHWAGGHIEQLYRDGITSGCAATPLRFCPDARVTRAEMAIFLMRSRYGSTFNPGTATGTVFADVPGTYWAAAWIEKFYQYGFTTGCSSNPLSYCPDAPVSRAEMAVFMKRVFSLAAPPV